MNYVILVIGFILLIKGADYFVEGSAAVAKKFKVPTFIIGMTIVAMGTSAPECAVSVSAALKGANELAISNVVGSNMFNLMIVCGVCTLFMPLVVAKSTIKREFPFVILVGLILLAMAVLGRNVNHIEGVILLAIFVFFLVWMVRSARDKSPDMEEEVEDLNKEVIKELAGWKCALFILLGGAAIAFGGQFVVTASTAIAKQFGLGDTLIGLTVVAFGTSLPELVTSVVAARKNQLDMALGNVLGSNIFNILLVLGLAATISPLTVLTENVIDLIALTIMTLIVYAFVVRDHKINRGQGIIMMAIYFGYIVYTIYRVLG